MFIAIIQQVPSTSSNRSSVRRATRILDRSFIRIGIDSGRPWHVEKDRVVPMIQVALVQEFGAPSAYSAPAHPPIPERSYIRSTIHEHRARYRRMALAAARRTIRDGSGIAGELESLAQAVVSDVRSRIAQGDDSWLPLADSTIAKKGHDRPLQDSKQLMDAIGYQITVSG